VFPFLLQGKFDTKLSQPGHFGQERFGAKFMINYTYCPFSFVGPIYINKTATFGRKNQKICVSFLLFGDDSLGHFWRENFVSFFFEMIPWATFYGLGLLLSFLCLLGHSDNK
jgi:hypothetical protein